MLVNGHHLARIATAIVALGCRPEAIYGLHLRRPEHPQTIVMVVWVGSDKLKYLSSTIVMLYDKRCLCSFISHHLIDYDIDQVSAHMAKVRVLSAIYVELRANTDLVRSPG